MARINISVPDDLKRLMDLLGEGVNWSQVATDAFLAKVEELDAKQQEAHRTEVAHKVRQNLYEGINAASPPPHYSMEGRGLRDARALASHFYKPADQRPFIETFFCSTDNLELTKDQVRLAPRLARVATRHDYPIHFVEGWEGPQLQSEGWFASLPSHTRLTENVSPSYFWALTPTTGFVDRDPLWEDKDHSLIRGGVGLMHVSIRTVLLLRFLRRLGLVCSLDPSRKFVVGIRVAHIKGRFLRSEYATELFDVPRTQREHVETSGLIRFEDLKWNSLWIATTLLEDLAWKFERTDLTKKDFEAVIETASHNVESACHFPNEEAVKAIDSPE